ncbi:MAG: GntR family transcriptional regulator, partial [Bacillota bacterium]|nr:GntR family transcriptional regulator [Bacillota bacterium]
MPWELKSDRPISTQLIEQIELMIVSGVYPPGSKLPSVRDMA